MKIKKSDRGLTFSFYNTEEFAPGERYNYTINGWATNKAHKVGMKVILPAYGVFCDSKWSSDTFRVNEAYAALADIEKVFNYLDGAITEEVNLTRMLQMANSLGNAKNISCKYFSVTFYKKGTVHIKMHPKTQRIVDALNIYVARGRKWLPPSYGKVRYEEMDAKSQQVIDEFQGKEAYNIKMQTAPCKSHCRRNFKMAIIYCLSSTMATQSNGNL